MSNEELNQRGYLLTGSLKGRTFGRFEYFDLGSTRLDALVQSGLDFALPTEHRFSPSVYKAPATPAALKPDDIVADRASGALCPVAVIEHKGPREWAGRNADKKILSAQEQAVMSAVAMGAPIAVATDSSRTYYVDVDASVDRGEVVLLSENRTPNPGVLDAVLAGPGAAPKDPTPLAEQVWQLIWHATKAEPKECLLTFVEMFVLKFLTDNLPSQVLPTNKNFYYLVGDPAAFKAANGVTEVEYYVNQIRPEIKRIFPDNTICDDPEVANLLGLGSVVSKTSVINGFVFLQSSQQSPESYNMTFRSVIEAFNNFGALVSIDPEFKLRLYETFLRRSARQQRLGQFFTPRNVVTPMIRMAEMDRLPDGAMVLDPAAGVGGFVLEPLMWDHALAGNITIESGRPKRRVRTVGIDVDPDLHILAKANMLLHVAELVRDPATTPSALNKAMAETFVLHNENQTLGSLLDPPTSSVDLILTNPPYVTRGSGVYKETIKRVPGPRNGVDLKDYYDRAGLGVEALFLRYISGALKPGARALVIVPQGMLNRTEPGPKSQLLDECNILASIQLPRNAFFNTAQKTYILVLEKRHTEADPRPDVLCGLARSTGETLDHRRTPTPDDNDLDDIAGAFVAWVNGDDGPAKTSPVIQLVSADNFGTNDRWDVVRFWDDDELVALGENSAPVTRADFMEETESSISDLLADLADAKNDLGQATATQTVTVRLSDASVFTVASGTRITTRQVQEHPPEDELDAVPVYSCFKHPWITKGDVSKSWLGEQQRRDRRGVTVPRFPLEKKPVVTVNANGASVGKVFLRPAGCLITDDVIAVHVADGVDILPEYLAVALQDAVNAGGFLYEAKLFATRVRELDIQVPISADGSFDLDVQRQVAAATKRLNALVTRLGDLGRSATEARLV